MNLNSILKKAWQILWNYRALWLFGTILALVGTTAISLPAWPDWQNNDQWTRIKLSEATILKLPGADVTIDLTAPGGFRITTPDNFSWHEFNDLVDMLEHETTIELGPILIELAVLAGSLLLCGLLARYVAETALIRMVGEAEGTGRHLNTWHGLRKGCSIRACRLFLLDLSLVC